MAKKTKIERFQEPVVNGPIGVPESKNVNKEDFLAQKAKELNPKPAETSAVKFAGVGIRLYTLADPTGPGGKRNFCVDFGKLCSFVAKHPLLIEALRKNGFKEV